MFLRRFQLREQRRAATRHFPCDRGFKIIDVFSVHDGGLKIKDGYFFFSLRVGLGVRGQGFCISGLIELLLLQILTLHHRLSGVCVCVYTQTRFIDFFYH